MCKRLLVLLLAVVMIVPASGSVQAKEPLFKQPLLFPKVKARRREELKQELKGELLDELGAKLDADLAAAMKQATETLTNVTKENVAKASSELKAQHENSVKQLTAQTEATKKALSDQAAATKKALADQAADTQKQLAAQVKKAEATLAAQTEAGLASIEKQNAESFAKVKKQQQRALAVLKKQNAEFATALADQQAKFEAASADKQAKFEAAITKQTDTADAQLKTALKGFQDTLTTKSAQDIQSQIAAESKKLATAINENGQAVIKKIDSRLAGLAGEVESLVAQKIALATPNDDSEDKENNEEPAPQDQPAATNENVQPRTEEEAN